MRKKRIDPEVSAYMAKIGRRGARSLNASLTGQERSERCRRAVQARWEKYRARKEKEKKGSRKEGR